MRQLTIIERGKDVNDTDLEDFKTINSIKISDSFLAFLIHQNPIETAEKYFPIAGQEPYYINGFYPFDNSRKDSIQAVFDSLNDFFEGKYLAFADDSGGWQFVISVQASDFGKVYFCRMDEALEDALTLLADSFEEFVEKLQRAE